MCGACNLFRPGEILSNFFLHERERKKTRQQNFLFFLSRDFSSLTQHNRTGIREEDEEMKRERMMKKKSSSPSAGRDAAEIVAVSVAEKKSDDSDDDDSGRRRRRIQHILQIPNARPLVPFATELDGNAHRLRGRHEKFDESDGFILLQRDVGVCFTDDVLFLCQRGGRRGKGRR